MEHAVLDHTEALHIFLVFFHKTNSASSRLTFPLQRIIFQSALRSRMEHPHIKLRNSEQTEETCVSEPCECSL